MVTIPRLAIEPQVLAAAKNQPPLAIGSSGNGVVILQQALIDLSYEMPRSTHNGNSLPDGIFGIETEQVVKRFQQSNNLKVDGIAGRFTFQRLEQALIMDHDRREAELRRETFNSSPV